MALVSLVVVCASIAIFADLYASADHQSSVIIVTETIQQGQLFAGSQLGEASASISSGVTAIPVADAVGALGSPCRGHHRGRFTAHPRRCDHRRTDRLRGMPWWGWL